MPVKAAKSTIRLLRLALFIAMSLPLLGLAWAWHQDSLGVMPEEVVLHSLGRWGLYALLATLALGPLFRLTDRLEFMMVRRQLGLWSFAYITGHLLAWAWLELHWMWSVIWLEFSHLVHLQIGLLSWLLLIPLVITSIPLMQRALGMPRWRWLHRLSYLCAAGGILHFFLLARGFRTELWLALLALGLLIVLRLLDAKWLSYKAELQARREQTPSRR